MTIFVSRRWPFVLLFFCLAFAVVAAQEHSSSSPAQSGTQSQPQPAQHPESATQSQPAENPNAAVGQELVETSREAAGEESKEENAQFKYSKTVQWLGRHLGLSDHQTYWVALVVNFGILGWFFYTLLKSKLPQAFRERKTAIQKALREAQAASADAARRLSEIEARLARLDTEITELRTSAERDAAAEEERVRQAAEEDKHKVVQAAETEIAALARNARRELKNYAAGLAVDMAARKIRVDEPTDQALVHNFMDQLGRDGS